MLTDRLEEAFQLLSKRRFHPWEGGEGQVLRAFSDVQLARAQVMRQQGALALAQQTVLSVLQPPDNLGESRHLLAADPDAHVELAHIAEQQGAQSQAQKYWHQAAAANGDFLDMAVTVFSPATWYRGLALQALKRESEANTLFNQLHAWALEQQQLQPRIDYFATSLPDLVFEHDGCARRDRDCQVLLGIACRGLNNISQAQVHFRAALDIDPACYEAHKHLCALNHHLVSTSLTSLASSDTTEIQA